MSAGLCRGRGGVGRAGRTPAQISGSFVTSHRGWGLGLHESCGWAATMHARACPSIMRELLMGQHNTVPPGTAQAVGVDMRACTCVPRRDSWSAPVFFDVMSGGIGLGSGECRRRMAAAHVPVVSQLAVGAGAAGRGQMPAMRMQAFACTCVRQASGPRAGGGGVGCTIYTSIFVTPYN